LIETKIVKCFSKLFDKNLYRITFEKYAVIDFENILLFGQKHKMLNDGSLLSKLLNDKIWQDINNFEIAMSSQKFYFWILCIQSYIQKSDSLSMNFEI